jgi:imidazolonepropionase-like amidohydrolase
VKILLKNATLWDAAKGWRQNDLLLDGDRIAQEGKLTDAEADQTYDLTGYTLLPGFVDAHIHIALDDSPFQEDALLGWAKNGVAAVRDCAMLSGLAVPDFMRWQEEHESTRWPLVVNTGKYIDVPGGYGAELPAGHPIGLTVETPEEAAAAVDYLWENGCTQLKIALDDSPSPFSPEPRQHNLTPELIRAITTRAGEHGMGVTAHVLAAKHLRTLVDCGISDAGHTPTDPVPDSLLQEMAQRGIPMVTTAVGPVQDNTPGLKPKRPGPPPPPPEVAEQMALRKAEATRNAVSNLRRFHGFGGKILLGTDLMFSNNYDTCACIPVLEMEALRGAEIPTEDILTAGTAAPAQAIGLGDQLGTLECGKLACVVAVPGDLSGGFDALRQPALVINRGAVLTNQL